MKKKQKTVNTFKQSQIQVFEKIKKGNLVLKTRPKDEDKPLNTKSLLNNDYLKTLYFSLAKPLMSSVSHHMESSQLIFTANQLTGFYMMEKIGS